MSMMEEIAHTLFTGIGKRPWLLRLYLDSQPGMCESRPDNTALLCVAGSTHGGPEYPQALPPNAGS